MTREEAAEVILRGDAWVTCSRCEGEGNHRIEGGRGWDGCVPCEGYGTVIALDYHEACQLLGKELPERDHDQRSFTRSNKPQKVIFPTFEISDQKPNLEAYDLPISRRLDDAKRQSVEEIDQEIIFDDN